MLNTDLERCEAALCTVRRCLPIGIIICIKIVLSYVYYRIIIVLWYALGGFSHSSPVFVSPFSMFFHFPNPRSPVKITNDRGGFRDFKTIAHTTGIWFSVNRFWPQQFSVVCNEELLQQKLRGQNTQETVIVVWQDLGFGINTGKQETGNEFAESPYVIYVLWWYCGMHYRIIIV